MVLASGPDATATESTRTTAFYRDPLHATPAPPVQPTESTMGTPGMSIVRVNDPGDPGRQLAVALFEVRYDDGRPYADVLLPGTATSTYCPMVRLAVARYQEHSLPGLELSELITCEPVSVLPSRTLVVERQGALVVVTLRGVGPSTFLTASRSG